MPRSLGGLLAASRSTGLTSRPAPMNPWPMDTALQRVRPVRIIRLASIAVRATWGIHRPEAMQRSTCAAFSGLLAPVLFPSTHALLIFSISKPDKVVGSHADERHVVVVYLGPRYYRFERY